MALRILTNIPALRAVNQLNLAESRVNVALERLSTGLVINRASDGPSELIAGRRLQAEERLLGRAGSNVSDGLSLLEVTEGALNEITNILQRLGELATISSNGINNPTTRKPLQSEFAALGSEITRIARTVSFNNIVLLSNTGTAQFPVTFQVGTDGTASSRVTYGGVRATLFELGLGNSNESQRYQVNGATAQEGQDNAMTALVAVMAALDTITVLRGTVGAISSRLSFSLNELKNRREATASAAESILSADIATESANLLKARSQRDAAIFVLAQVQDLSRETALKLLL